MKKILITGGMGYIGSYLAQHLDAEGFDVFLTRRRGGKSLPELHGKYPVKDIDLLDASSLNGVCNGMDIVVHTATYDERLANGNPAEALTANGYATRALLEDARLAEVKRFIYLSTFHVYGRSNGRIDESIPVAPVSDYALTHYVAELYCNQYAEKYGMDNRIVRLTNGYGAPMTMDIDKWYLVLNDFCRSVFESQRIELKTPGLQKRDFIGIRDVCSAIGLLAQCERSHIKERIYNVSSGNAVSMRELAALVAQAYQSRYDRYVDMIIPEPPVGALSLSEELLVDSGRLRSLGWQPTASLLEEVNLIFNLLERSNHQ